VGQETNKIKQHIDDERADLDRNFREIEYRLKDATDLKAHFDKNTGLILGAAVAGGFFLALTLGKSADSPENSNWQAGPREHEKAVAVHATHHGSTHLNRVSETVNDIFAGLVGVFSDRLQSFVADAVPGFREQFDSIKQRASSSDHQVRSVL